MKEVIEWAEFTLKPGVGEAELQRGSEGLERDFLAGLPGYIRRELVRLDERRYADLVWWASHADAEKAMAQAAESQACATYFGLMEMNAENAEAGVRHYAVVARYGAPVSTAA